MGKSDLMIVAGVAVLGLAWWYFLKNPAARANVVPAPWNPKPAAGYSPSGYVPSNWREWGVSAADLPYLETDSQGRSIMP